jgi:hypothetical protein
MMKIFDTCRGNNNNNKIMADLEDKIFKQNVPGRWSSHEGSASEVRPNDVLASDEFHEDET